MEDFVVRHYSVDERPTIKGNGFDGLHVGENREEAQVLTDYINRKFDKLRRLSVSHAALLAALERTSYALSLALSQKPLRDMTETLAEAENAIKAAKELG